MSQEWSALGRHEKSLLWQQRLFEAEAGLTRHLAVNRRGRHLTDWIHIRSDIFSNLPRRSTDAADDHPAEDDPAAWQRVFFRAQALMERFLVSRYGHGELRAWADSVAEVHRHVEPSRGAGALGPVLRLARQAELYGSRFRLREAGPQRSSLDIEHCGIWDYRERARRQGVPLTLASPCAYCTHATTANVAAKGYRARHELTDGADGPGCRWEVSTPAEPVPAPPPEPAASAAPAERVAPGHVPEPSAATTDGGRVPLEAPRPPAGGAAADTTAPQPKGAGSCAA